MLPTTPANVDQYFARFAPEARARVLAAYPGYPRRRALEEIGADAMFVAPTWAFADAYSAFAPTYVYRFDHTSATLRATGLGAIHGSEIVHILHTYGSHLGRRLHPLGRWLTPAVGRRMQRTWLEFAGAPAPIANLGLATGPATTPHEGAPASFDRSPMSRSTTPMRPAARRGTAC
jgi:para-nitrobenzyl esterase